MTDQGTGQPGEPEMPPATPMPQMSGGAGSPADVGVRVLARLLDHILLSILIFAIIVPLVLVSMFADAGGFGFGFGGFSVGTLVTSIVSAVIVIAYFALMESRNGQTVGKMLLGIRTLGPDGSPPSMEQAIKRNSWYLVGIIPFLGGLAQLAIAIYIVVTISNSATKTGWHDTFAGGTKVVKTK